MYKEYRIIFDERSQHYNGNHEYDLLYLESQLKYFRDIYSSRGYLFIRDICENLGIPVTRDILGAGWHVASGFRFHAGIIDAANGSFVISLYASDNIAEFFEES